MSTRKIASYIQLSQFCRKETGRKAQGEAGYTILEAIVAMVVVATLMTAVAPVIVFSIGTRLQARRVELATQAARTYIDWVSQDPIKRVTTKSGTTFNPIITEVSLTPDQMKNSRGNFTSSAAPTNSTLDCPTANDYCTAPAAPNKLFCVDFDGDGKCDSSSQRDMIVQGFRSIPNVTGATNDPKQGYLLGVRVYRASAFQAGVDNLVTTSASTNVTNAISNLSAPVVTMTTEISPTGQKGFDSYCQRLEGCGNTTSP